MDPQDVKDLQISLHTTLSGVSLHKDLGIPDDTSSITSSFSTFSFIGPQVTPPTQFEKGIPIKLAHWGWLIETPVQSEEEGRLRAASIFQYFVDSGKNFGMEDTPCIKMLEKAVETCMKASEPEFISSLTGAEKVVQRTRATASSYVAILRAYVLDEIPIFNIMEAICWVYSCCVEGDEIRTDKEAECYLYQLLLIFSALRATRWVPTDLIPSTVAAAWSCPSDDTPLTIAFACACVGKKPRKLEMNAAWRDYVKGLHAQVQNFTFGYASSNSNSLNRAGNCPEFIVWGSICRAEGLYKSLCLNIPGYRTYKCCTHCDTLAKASWEGNRVRIEDRYDKTTLRIGVSYKLPSGYEVCDLKPIRNIIEEGRGRKVAKKR